MTLRSRRLAALSMALLCHGTFVVAVASMALALATGLQFGRGTLPNWLAPFVNLLLVLQFPVLHSYLLNRRGRPLLQRLSPVGFGRELATSTYVLVGSLQLLLTFWAWTPSGVVWHTPDGVSGGLQWTLFVAAWLFLQKALFDAGLGLQTGFVGWWSLLRNRPVDYGEMPTNGLFASCRQPIYLGFALVLWTGPVWSLDWLCLSIGWSLYCVVGPRLKEARWARLYGERFTSYQASVPYLLPRLRR
ncbi:MAG: isoprenylcysteine carboxylmethyltransferase family protein [Planctomycetes bacterium]|nr:isoprenylcysteine carboxylmethyltransferase family protein [Planctomycetota bacterium]